MAASGAYPVLSLLDCMPPCPPATSLGEHIAAHVTHPQGIQTLLDCLCSSPRAALLSPDPNRPPLDHNMLRETLTHFSLPVSPRARPLTRGDRVMVVLPTGPENAVALMAVAAYHTAVPLNAACTARELRDDALRLGVRAIVATRDSVGRLDLRSLYEHDGLEIILLDFLNAGPAGLFDIALIDSGDPVTSPLPVASRQQHLIPNGLNDYPLVLQTSGTSGTKKIVPYTLRHLVVGTCCVVASWQLTPDSVNSAYWSHIFLIILSLLLSVNMMPLFHVGGIIRNLWAPVFSCGCAIMCTGFDSSTWWTLVHRYGATWYYAAPTMHQAILAARPDNIDVERDIKIRLICNAAGGLLPSLADQMQKVFRCTILPSYGMTECMPIASPATTYQLERPGCSGIACGPRLAIRDPIHFNRCAAGTSGAVCVRGLPLFDGYEVQRGQLDTSCFSRSGWFDTGDVGHMDQDGYLYITGRSKEIINKGGEVISPFEIEEAIMVHARDRVCAVLAFAIDHPVLQETVGVVIVPQPNRPRIGLAQLQSALHNGLHQSKWPFAVVYMDDLPKNQAGKPMRIKLAQRLGIPSLSDDAPMLDRHFEAKAPDKSAPTSVPIPSSKVQTDPTLIERACGHLQGCQEVAILMRPDGSSETFLHMDANSHYNAENIEAALSQVLDGYNMPTSLHVFGQELARKRDGTFDFAAMQQEVRAHNQIGMSHAARVVRDCVATLLMVHVEDIKPESDFFFLGGNSLLLGRLISAIRKELNVTLDVSSVFTHSTIAGIAELAEQKAKSSDEDDDDCNPSGYYDRNTGSQRSPAHQYEEDSKKSYKLHSHGQLPRSQTHPLVLFVQILPLMFMHPLKAAWTWTVLLQGLAFSAYYINDNFWCRLGVLLAALVVARLTSRIICPLTAILFKWVVIGRYRPGKYPMWCNYHLRWWIVNQSLTMSGKGLFNLSASLRMAYFRLLGAAIGHDVMIDKDAKLGEYDLLTIHNGARIDRSVVRGFAVERDGCFRLEPIVIGRNTVINTYTQISPGAHLADGMVWGPQASSHEEPSEDAFAAYNTNDVPQPHMLLITLVGLPIKLFIMFLCYIPWFAALFMLLSQPFLFDRNDSVKGVISWFSYPQRIGWHFIARIVRNTMPPLSNIILGIIVKRIFGLNQEGTMRNASQWSLFRRWLCGEVLSQKKLRRGFSIVGTHYEMTSVVYRAMGADVGKRVYWPGSGVYCPDPEFLRVGDDVVFGSRSELITSDPISSSRITIASGAMVADRVTLLPGTTVGRQAIMGSGALSRRNGYYEPLSIWMGTKHGGPVSFGKSSPSKDSNGSTITPFGRAFYLRQAPYFVFPYLLIVLLNATVAVACAVYWAIPAPVAVVVLNRVRLKYEYTAPGLFSDHWYRPALLYMYIALAFVVVMFIQAILAFVWVIGTKWIIIGRRQEGQYDWDKSAYCQRWQLHLVLQRLLLMAPRILGTISGTWYAVLYLRLLGAKIGQDCAIWAGGKPSLQLTEPDLVTMGDRVAVDDASVVAHINSRGRFSLNELHVGDGCALRTGSRLLSGASMEPHSMLLEHTLLAAGEIAEARCVYAGWPARQMRFPSASDSPRKSSGLRSSRSTRHSNLHTEKGYSSGTLPLPTGAIARMRGVTSRVSTGHWFIH